MREAGQRSWWFPWRFVATMGQAAREGWKIPEQERWLRWTVKEAWGCFVGWWAAGMARGYCRWHGPVAVTPVSKPWGGF